jgi:DNA-binding transcriptional ArsR family regulator
MRPTPPGTSKNPLKITDPRVMRALAHPARIAILQHLALDGPSTATECADIAGLSPSACSYHLRALARFGFVEEEPASAADGRHRPWRARVIAFSIGNDSSPSVRAAESLLRKSLQARFDEVRAEYLDREPGYPPEWREAGGHDQDVLHVSAEELLAVRDQVRDLLARYRRLDPAERPPGVQRVHVMFELIPWFDPGGER